MRAYCLNKISPIALASLAGGDCVVEDINSADAILVRSAKMHEMTLPNNILAIARAGAGVNNIPFMDYANNGVVVFNTPGANANAVKELVLCGLLLASRDIIGGNQWVKDNQDLPDLDKAVEKAKSQFAGNEILGKTVAVLGLGKIGVLVANACVRLGMNVVGYDPYLNVANAMQLDKKVVYLEKIEDVVANADFVTVHIPAMDSTKGMINASLIKQMKDGVKILNFSRDSLVNETDLLASINANKVAKYVTDFATVNVVKNANTIVLPHLGASTEEAEDNCAYMAIAQLKDYLDNGNITNSVNYPNANAGVKSSGVRVCICHRNVPGIIAKFTALFSEEGINISNLVNKSKGDYAYSIVDADKEVDINALNKIEGVLKVRIL